VEEVLHQRQERRGVDVHRPVEVVEAQLADWLEDARRRVRHQDVEAAPGRLDLVEHPGDLGLVRYVALHKQGVGPARLDFLHHRLCRRTVAEEVDRHVHLEVGKREGYRPSDPARRARDQSTLAP
jgi:hypothetical protein